METLTSFLFLIKKALIFCIRPLMKNIRYTHGEYAYVCVSVFVCVYTYLERRKGMKKKSELMNNSVPSNATPLD